MKILKILNLDKLSKQQLIALSEITRDSAQVILGGVVINQFLVGLRNIDWLSFGIGIVSVIGLWIMSMIILKK